MNNQSEVNKAAWSYKAYEFWMNQLGPPKDAAQDMIRQPEKRLRRHLAYLGDVKGKRVANLLGSCGKKAIPLSLLGADVTIVDISEQNKKYAMEVAEEAKVKLTYIVSDLLALNIDGMNDFDIVYMEGGILHYFSDIDELSRRVYALLKTGGKLVLNDFHPIRKIFDVRDVYALGDEALHLTGDYFEDALQSAGVAHEKYFSEHEQAQFPKCLLRYWTMGEIITSFASVGFVIDKLVEIPRLDSHKNIPGEFILTASKLKMER
jgi:ubiquinone/menaquinone biosynthesis C-methylase UbiE